MIGRYAFWVEDESFRANVSYADGRTGAGGTFQPNDARRDNDPSDPKAKAALNSTDVSLLGLFTFLGSTDSTTARTNLLSARTIYPGKIFPDSGAYAHATGFNAAMDNNLRYLTTTQSAGLNLSRHGTQRLSLNAVVDPSITPTSANATATVQNEFDKIVGAIQFHASNFGQRFYRTTSNVDSTELNKIEVTNSTYRKMYVAKVAANIIDYIDSDSIPTCIFKSDANHVNGIVQNTANITIPIGEFSTTPPWAIGKDSGLYVSECAVRFSGIVSGSGAAAAYTLNTNYYIEVWNMGTRDIAPGDLGTQAYIRIGHPPRWVGCTAADRSLQKPLPHIALGCSRASYHTAYDTFSGFRHRNI